jgi:formylglycine-generating enzyme required for sulfatase activity
MVLAGDVCIDRYEAYVVEVDGAGHATDHSPYQPVGGLRVRAENRKGNVPQGYVSQVEAQAACREAGKRLCSAKEFSFACSGGDPAANDYPYGGHERRDGLCNEGKGSALRSSAEAASFGALNDPRLNQADGGLARSGDFPKCVSSFGVYDCVGNLHEWGSDPPDDKGLARLRGGFYGDAELNGHGCKYVTSAHAPTYHDYSTGFRCCAEPEGARPAPRGGPASS